MNCNAQLHGRYCHVCGQENVEPKQTFWHLVTHFIYDITHFDGKFFNTLKYLLLKPGFLSHEYLRGKRASYLDPIRMYVFTSAIFFIIFFAFLNPEPNINTKNLSTSATKNLSQQKEILQKQLDTTKDIQEQKDLKAAIKGIETASAYVKNKSDSVTTNDTSKIKNDSTIYFSEKPLPASVSKYDSIQNKLPPNKRDGWFTQLMSKRVIVLNAKYKENKNQLFHDLMEKFLHSLPQMMFISLPLVALILQLLYIRRKQYFYVNHAIFTIHIYIAIYILILIVNAFAYLADVPYLGWLTVLKTITIFAIFFYIYKAMRNFYLQGRFKTILKFFLLLFLYSFVLIFLMVIFFITSLFQI